jgi:hypothetical protein
MIFFSLNFTKNEKNILNFLFSFLKLNIVDWSFFNFFSLFSSWILLLKILLSQFLFWTIRISFSMTSLIGTKTETKNSFVCSTIRWN